MNSGVVLTRQIVHVARPSRYYLSIYNTVLVQPLMADGTTTDGGHAQQIRTKLLKVAYIIPE